MTDLDVMTNVAAPCVQRRRNIIDGRRVRSLRYLINIPRGAFLIPNYNRIAKHIIKKYLLGVADANRFYVRFYRPKRRRR
ncbi:protein of unknown function [Methylocella tundrae]|uniref:Uncharacterized protein n=1 Tax=Methylocella tundrae TaxID=227605 RepID=A0A4U8Z231_METTU|nr:protein of unknown function [Methylocella tundrae]